ncbi:U11/U12 small nuclear ribonucleoprotein 35 kDa protein [Hydra vulgaris]|uniref:U11/U12 small nuclear ribonucleoprotein 35 kDa protein n=1 Tax=Hydra vulgaris TaxID=6087 RepID=A0ABM4D7J2_HYDVU
MDAGESSICFLPYELPTFDNWSPIATFYHPLMAGSIDGTDTVPHDKAVIRASKSVYKPNKKVTGDPRKTIMVRHLSLTTNESTIKQIFQRFGEIKKCRLVRDIITGNSRRYAFIEYNHERDARHASRETKDLIIDECKVTIDFECSRTLPGWIPRRFGGGFGGKKESGQLRFGGMERPFRRPIPLNSKRVNDCRGIKRDVPAETGSKREENISKKYRV